MPEASGVQSVARALEILELMATDGGDHGVSQLADRTGLAMPTIHRLLRTLMARGYVRQLPSRRYALGAALIRLGDAAGSQLGADAEPDLAELAASAGETVNLAMLDQDQIVYIAQSASRHSMRMFTEVGRRAPAHATGVGKAILAQLPDEQVRALLARTGMPAATATTLTEPADLLAQLGRVRRDGYAIDEGEQEVGVRCFAVTVPGAPMPMAVSVSGPQERLTPDREAQIVPELHRTAERIATRLSTPTA